MEKNHHKVNRKLRIKSCLRFKTLKACQILLAIYIAFMVYTPMGTFGKHGGLVDPQSGYIIDPTSKERTEAGYILINGDLRPVVATNMFQMLCLGLSRMSAFFEYPALVFVLFSKLRATTAFLASTPFSMFMFEELHDLHVYCGTAIMFSGTIHTFAHVLRWADQGQAIYMLFNDRSGLSGVFILGSCLLICLPMLFWKTLNFELRKYTHYLFYVFVIALCFHAPPSAVPNGGFAPYVFGTLLVWTVLDSLYVYLYMTEKIETTVFNVVPTGVQLTMDVSARFHRACQQGGYCYVCFPWIAKGQWHAFSLFENPGNPRQRQIFMQKNGDWTTAVHDSLKRNTNRPIWVQGPFPSPYNNSIEYDNLLLVASGIGITPALSVIRRAHKEGARRPNLVWIVRDPHMLEFFMQESYLESSHGWTLVYYTGKQPFVANEDIESQSETNICVVHGRPELENVIPAIIQGIETRKGLPEEYGPSKKKQEAVIKLSEELIRLESRGKNLSTQKKISHMAKSARKMGFLFTDLVSNLDGVSIDEHPHSSNLVVDDGSAGIAAGDGATVASTASKAETSVCRIYRQDSILEQLPSTASRLSSLQRKAGSKKKKRRKNQKDYTPPVPVDPKTGRLKKRIDPLFVPWESQEGSAEFVKQMSDTDKETWGILYCGGSKGLEAKLASIAYSFDLAFHTERFSW